MTKKREYTCLGRGLLVSHPLALVSPAILGRSKPREGAAGEVSRWEAAEGRRQAEGEAEAEDHLHQNTAELER